VEAKLAMTFVYAIGASLGFVANRKWTFSHSGTPFRVALRYVIAHLIGYSVNLVLLYIFVDNLGCPHQWVQAVAVVIVSLYLFLVFKLWVFRDKYADLI
jgi:putative flippase GtrA